VEVGYECGEELGYGRSGSAVSRFGGRLENGTYWGKAGDLGAFGALPLDLGRARLLEQEQEDLNDEEEAATEEDIEEEEEEEEEEEQDEEGP